MFDLFGLGKQQEPQEPAPGSEPAPAPEAAPEAPPRGSHKLWAFLLVLDSAFVIIFAGAVAAKVYQHWKAPAVVVAPSRRARPPKTADAPAASTAPAPAPEAVKPLEPPKPATDDRAIGRGSVASEVRQEATAPRPPKPSMLSEAPRHRGTPGLAPSSGATAPTAAAAPAVPGAPVKAIRTEFKLLAPKARSVELVGAFIVRGGRKDMARQDDGTWTVSLYLNPGTYRYFFSVDKKKQLDPANPLSDKGASLLTLP